MAEYNPGPQFRLSSKYGRRVDPNKPSAIEIHGGIDFRAPAATEIPAASDGVVVYSRTNYGGYGNTIIIRSLGIDGRPYYTLYSHMKDPSHLRFGDPVRAGKIAGYVGSTGKSTGPHLHFEVISDKAKKLNVDNNGPGIGITSSNLTVRANPRAFDNWAGGQPFGATDTVQADPSVAIPLPRPRPGNIDPPTAQEMFDWYDQTPMRRSDLRLPDGTRLDGAPTPDRSEPQKMPLLGYPMDEMNSAVPGLVGNRSAFDGAPTPAIPYHREYQQYLHDTTGQPNGSSVPRRSTRSAIEPPEGNPENGLPRDFELGGRPSDLGLWQLSQLPPLPLLWSNGSQEGWTLANIDRLNPAQEPLLMRESSFATR